MSNQRRHTRFKWTEAVEIEWSGRKLGTTSRNLSLAGMFLETPDSPPLGARVTLRLRLPGIPETCSLPSIVRWSQSGKGIGVQFESLRAREVWAMNKLLHGLEPMEPD
jgi:hypothetical protein